VAVIGHQAWTRVFRADPSVVGRVIRIEGIPVTIVGVGPVNHHGTIDVGLGTDFWLPTTALPAVLANKFASVPRRDASTIAAPLLVKARLREGVTLPQAKAAMDVLAERLAVEYPDLFRHDGEFQLGKGITVVASTSVRVHPQADAPIIALASLVLVIVGLVLAIATSNLATMLLVRGAARAKEISVRLAIGAGRSQLVRQLLTESLLLSLAGGIAGCVLAWWSLQALRRIDLPVRVDFTLDYRVLAFAIALPLVTGVAFGLAPALKATRVDLLSTLRDEGLQPIDHRRLSLKNALIVFQVAVSVLMLGGTSIFVQQAAAAKALRVGYAGPGFFDTLRIPVIYGRGFDTRDRADTPRVAVITDRMARQHFGTADAVGRRFRLATDSGVWMEVIGVVRDTGTGRFDDDVLDPIAPPFYTSYTQTAALPTTIIARTRGDANALLAAMQRELREVDATLPVMTARTMAENLAAAQAAPTAIATLLGILGVLALVLASIGLYAVVAYAVARRTREIGIRMALGARSLHVVWSIARGVAGLVGVGTGIGLILSVLTMLALRASSSTDIGIGNISVYRPNVDPVALLAIAAVMAIVGVAAAFVPARQAVRMAPLAALRHE
jgi:ABC-type antimicrobial peptide transport system permease subunit